MTKELYNKMKNYFEGKYFKSHDGKYVKVISVYETPNGTCISYQQLEDKRFASEPLEDFMGQVKNNVGKIAAKFTPATYNEIQSVLSNKEMSEYIENIKTL